MDQDIRCETCKYYKPLELDGWGVCTLQELWLARSQEVPADIHACEERGSRWTPHTSRTETAKAQTPARTVASQSAPSRRTLPPEALWPPAASAPALPSGASASKPVGRTSRPGVWLMVIGGIGLILSPLAFILDVLFFIPGLPESTIVLMLISIVLLVVGAIQYFTSRMK